MVRPQGALSFCGYVPTVNTTNGSSVFSNECFIDVLRTIPHVLFTFFIIPPLIALNRGSHYHARTWVHFPWHKLRWIITFILMVVHILAIAEGFMSDGFYNGSHMHFFMPSIMSLLGTAMAITYYHNVEMWNSPNFLQLPLVLYWLMNTITETLKAVCLSLKQVDYIYMRVHINWVLVLLYACLLLLELDTRRQMRLFFCYKKPNILVPPEDLVHIFYIHDKVSLLSRMTFFWIQRIIRKGFHGFIDWRDLGILPKEDQVSYEMKRVASEINENKIFSDGLSLHIIYCQLLRHSLSGLAVGMLLGSLSDLIACFLPVMLGFLITQVEKSFKEEKKTENYTLPVNAQYISVVDFFNSSYILLTIISVLLVICTLMKEAAKHIMARISLRLDNIIKAIIIRKLLQLRLKKIPKFVDAQQTATELINADWKPFVLGLFCLYRYFLKITVCYVIIYYYCGPLSHIVGLVFLIGILPVLSNYHEQKKRVMLTGNLQYIKQVLLQGDNTTKIVTDQYLNSQVEEMACLKKPVLLFSLYEYFVEITVIGLSMILFPSMMTIQDEVPSVSSIIVVLLLLHCIKVTMPDISGLVDLLNARILLGHAGELLRTEPVLGRSMKTIGSSDASEASAPVVFSLEFKARTPSPEHDVNYQIGNNGNSEKNPFLEEQMLSSSKSSSDSSTAAMEMTEVTPMLHTIAEEESGDASEVDKHVKFSADPETDAGTSASLSTQGSVPEKSLSQHQSSGTFSRLSDTDDSTTVNSGRGVDIAIEIQAASCQDVVTLQDISIRVDEGKLTIITGPKLSGKSLLLDGLMLGNIESMSGEVTWKTDTTVSYSGYPAWILQASVMENILFGLPYDRHRYLKVLKASALMSDIESFPDKDLTILGTYQLTDGQRNRITLARALYSHSDVVILNEPLSCMNVNKGSEIFEEGILKFLLKRKRTVILATKQIQFFPFAHMIYRIENGKITHRGSLKDIKAADGNLFNRWQSIAKMVRRESYANLSMSVNRIHTGQHRDRHESASKSAGSQDASKMVISPAKYYTQTSRGSDISERTMSDSCVMVSESGSAKPLYSTQSSRELQDDLLDDTEKGPVHLHGAFTYHTPRDYLGYAKFTYIPGVLWKMVIKFPVLILCLALVVPMIVLTVIAYIYLLLWAVHPSSTNDSDPVVVTDAMGIQSKSYSYLTLWSCLAGVTCVLTLCLKLAISFCGLMAAVKAHRDLVSLLLQSTVSSLTTSKARLFLSQLHETKGIRQLQKLCERLADWLSFVVLILCTIVILAIASPYLLIPAIILLIPEGLLIMSYYSTSRQLFTLYQFAKTSLLSTVYDFLNGLSVIRAYSRQEYMLDILFERFDAQSNVLLWKLALNSWFSIRMHLLLVIVFMCCGLGLIHKGEDSLTVFILAAFILILSLYYMRDVQLSDVHTMIDGSLSLGSILKMSELIEVDPFVMTDVSRSVPREWPKTGCITYTNVTLQIPPNEQPVITEANFSVSSGDKLGICGAAGSGKSALIMALAKVSELSHGKLLIDDLDVTDIPPNVIYSKLTIIPQDASILRQTVRFNLCPDGSKSDAKLWEVLEMVELKDVIETFPEKLDQIISEEFVNSTEKQQLLLASTLIRESGIIVLDSVIRPENNIVRHVLDKLFLTNWKDTTVIIVTNQADFLLSATQIIVLESGRIVEQGHPATLVKNKSPFFPPVNLP